MVYKIKYPYYGIAKRQYFVILDEKNCVVLEHKGTIGFGLSSYISRKKILDMFKFSKEITAQQFQEQIKRKLFFFFKSIPGTTIKQETFFNNVGKLPVNLSNKEE